MMRKNLLKKITFMIMLTTLVSTSNADVNQAVDNFFSSITANVNDPTIVHNQSAGVLSGGGFATRSQVVNLQPMTFTPPTFNASCGNMNFYSGSLSFMTNTDQLVAFMQNTLMTAGVTAVMTALKAVTPNIAGTLQSMFDAAQKMLGMFNNSCQLGMALGNAGDSWVYDRLGKAKSQAYSDSSDAAGAEINSTTGGSSGSSITDKMNKVTQGYQNWVNANANMNPNDTSNNGSITADIAKKYGSVIWKGMQALHLYSLPIKEGEKADVASVANLVISLTGDLIIYSPTNDGTGTQVRVIPPTITDVGKFMATENNIPVYNCEYFAPDKPGECTGNNVDFSTLVYPTGVFEGGVVKKIKKAIMNIQVHFTNGTALTNDDMLIIAISRTPIFAIAQTLDDIGMTASISNTLDLYSEQIAYEVLQNLINTSLSLAIQGAAARTNKDTQEAINGFIQSIVNLQTQVNSKAGEYKKLDSIAMLQQLNFLRGYAQNQMSAEIMQKVNFAKQLGSQ